MHFLTKLLSLASSTLLFTFSLSFFPGLIIDSGMLQAQESQTREAEADRLYREAFQLWRRGRFREALENFQQALVIYQEVGNREGEGETFNGIGEVYRNLGHYSQALEYLQQALVIRKEIGDRYGEGLTLNNLGSVYHSLGKYPQALEYYEQALAIRNGNLSGLGTTLNNIGALYYSLGKYPQAIEYYQQAFLINRGANNRYGESLALSNLGVAYHQLNNYPQAIEYYQQALAIRTELGDHAGLGQTLNNLGAVYQESGKYPQAIEYYQQALVIRKEVGDRSGEAKTLNNLGYIFDAQKQPELAIIFLKQSVNTFETIRQDNRQLSTELEQSYTDTVAHVYRKLADLLLKNDRILEAQRVLDLLKVQELDDYLRGVRGTEDSAQGIYILRPEAEIIAKFNQRQQTAIEIGQELTQLRKIPEVQRTAPQQQRLTELIELETAINRQFNDFIDSDEIVALLDQLSRNTRRANPDLAQFNALRDNLANIGNAALFYPLILEDRLELVITTPNSPPLRRTVQGVGREELNQAILEFRRALQTYQHPRYRNNAKIQAQKLYQWLIAPIESDLTQANIQTIIYAPDGQLRYIPLAALHDGEKWLVQNYRINNITAASLTDFDTESAEQPQILAGAFSDKNTSYSIQMGNSRSTFSGLPFAGQEVANLVVALPNTISFINQEFSLQAIKPRLNQHNIIHFATHAAFVPTVPEDSFILFGNGDRPTLAEIKNWSLQNVDLVVLSACETGVGGELGDGVEILGLGYQFQRAGARATLASLWKVSDGGTQALMDNFYAAMKQGNSKAEALQKAQIALIEGKLINSDLSPQIQKQLSHPYFWSAFFLIGNGL